MLSLCAANTGQAISLLLWATSWEKIVQVVVVAPIRIPHLAKVFDHVAYLRLDLMFLVVIPDEEDHVPVFFRQGQTFLRGKRLHEIVRPFFKILQIPFLVNQNDLITNFQFPIEDGVRIRLHRRGNLGHRNRSLALDEIDHHARCITLAVGDLEGIAIACSQLLKKR